MAKKYKDEIAERIKANPTSPNRNLAAFLSMKNNIEEAMNEGYPLKAIWKDLNSIGCIGFGYVQFTHYVKKYIKKSNVLQKKEPEEVVEKTKEPISPGKENFWNPIPNKDNLI